MGSHTLISFIPLLENLFSGFVAADALDKIEKLREEQKMQLEEFREDFEQGISREERLKKSMKPKVRTHARAHLLLTQSTLPFPPFFRKKHSN